MEHGGYISKAKIAAEFDFMEKYVFCYGDPDDIAEAKKRILCIPKEDIVPVVRCKDCRMFMEYKEPFKSHSGYDGACRLYAGYTDCDREMRKYMDYCSDGERKKTPEVV